MKDADLYTHVAKWGVKNEISFRSRTTSGCPRVQSSKLPEGSISVMEVQENGDLEGCEAIIAISDLGNINNNLTMSTRATKTATSINLCHGDASSSKFPKIRFVRFRTLELAISSAGTCQMIIKL